MLPLPRDLPRTYFARSVPIAVIDRIRPLAVALGACTVLLARPLVAQDTTRTDTTRARADTSRAAGDSALRRIRVLYPDTPEVPVQLPPAVHGLPQIHIPPPVPPPWGFGLEIGFTDIGGNRDLQVFNGVFTSEHKRTTDYVFNTRFEARYGHSDGTVAAAYAALKTRFDWHPRAGTSPFVELDIESDRIAKYDERITSGTGLNFNIAPREDRHTTVSVGLAADIENRFAYVVPNNVTDIRYTLRFSTLQPVDGSTVFEANATLQPVTRDVSNYLLNAVASLKVTMTRKIAFRTRYEWKRDSRPAAGVNPDDRTFTVALAYSW